MRSGVRIGVVIPALNEERAIGRVIGAIPEWVDDIIVVDNGSTDATSAVAKAAGARVVHEAERGYGAACQTGIRAIGAAEIVVFLDGDYSDEPREMARLVDPIADGRCDLVVGSRVKGTCEPGALTPQQRFGNWLACLLMRKLWGADYSDLGPFRAIRREALERIAMTDRNYGWTVEMQIKGVIAGLKTEEVPVSYRARIGTSKISRTVAGSAQAGATILRVIAASALRSRAAAAPEGRSS